ncbi:MAG: MerC domain-containing protein [Porticoccaceae bacterium]|nr:MerC domain-containing protein [Porticoccaceae bacterium]
MKASQTVTDKLALGASLACIIHCLAFPLLIILVPSMTILQMNNDALHFWMAATVIPAGLFMLIFGPKQHNRYRFFVIAAIFLTLFDVALAL